MRANSAEELAELQEAEAHRDRLIGVEHGAIYALAQQLPEVNQLLERSFEDISSTFMQIASAVGRYQQNVEALEMADETRARLEELKAQISSDISKVVMGMQFQDRVSQNLVITINVLNDLLEEWPEGESTDARDLAFAKSVLEKMKLGEFRQRYLDYLLSHQLIDSALSIGFDMGDSSSASSASEDDDDDIDLF